MNIFSSFCYDATSLSFYLSSHLALLLRCGIGKGKEKKYHGDGRITGDSDTEGRSFFLEIIIDAILSSPRTTKVVELKFFARTVVLQRTAKANATIIRS